MEDSYKCFTKELLIMANKIAMVKGYNRRIDEDIVFGLPEDKVFPVTSHMMHEHIAGELQDVPHVRCCIIVPEMPYEGDVPKAVQRLQLDCDTEFFDNLPVKQSTIH